MKGLRTLLVKNFHYLCIVSVIAFGLITIVGSGGGGGGGGGDDGNACDGPVPCLTTDWGTGTAYIFVDQWDDEIMLMSFSGVVGGAGFYYDNDVAYMIYLTGNATDCYNAKLTDGYIDWNWDYDLTNDERLTSVSGDVNVCNQTLRISNFYVEGVHQDDVVATYNRIFYAAVSKEMKTGEEIPPEALQVLKDKMSEDW